MDIDAFEERAAIMEFDGGMSRFGAETAAARAQGYQRHEVMNAIRKRDHAKARDHDTGAARNAADQVSGVQPAEAKEGGPLPERDLQAGRPAVDVLVLRMDRG